MCVLVYLEIKEYRMDIYALTDTKNEEISYNIMTTIFHTISTILTQTVQIILLR